MSRKRNDLINKGGSALSNRRKLLAAALGMAATALLVTLGTGVAHAQQEAEKPATSSQAPAPTSAKVEQEVITLSKDKWRWMSERKVDSLAALFYEKAVFVHMGGSMSKKQELDTIRSGGIQYKNVEIQESSVQLLGGTAIVLNTIRLVAVVGGNEVTNPFVVTEVYVQESGQWKLAALAFTRTLR